MKKKTGRSSAWLERPAGGRKAREFKSRRPDQFHGDVVYRKNATEGLLTCHDGVPAHNRDEASG
jgi:hypothetical protein